MQPWEQAVHIVIVFLTIECRSGIDGACNRKGRKVKALNDIVFESELSLKLMEPQLNSSPLEELSRTDESF